LSSKDKLVINRQNFAQVGLKLKFSFRMQLLVSQDNQKYQKFNKKVKTVNKVQKLCSINKMCEPFCDQKSKGEGIFSLTWFSKRQPHMHGSSTLA